MPIIKKGSADNFMMMQRHPIQREDMSMRAKGLLAYLMSLPQDWVIHRTELVSHFKDGKDAVFAALNELIDQGYVVRQQERGTKGKFGEVTYTASDVTMRSPQTDLPVAVKPVTELPVTVNPHLQRNTIQSNSNTKKDSEQKSERRTDKTDDNYSNSAVTAMSVISQSITDNGLDFVYGPLQRHQLQEYVTNDGMDAEVVADAIKVTRESNQNSFKYTDGILKNRLAKHLLTMSAVIDNEKKRNYASDKYGDKQQKEIW
ncbi:DnaD domain protein [Weissella cibaria]|uniref:DnaD domain protein n=1 Tax=Weissella cibaria TaxID=137591 RepID=UPI000EDE6834|nr:DnaD domain protein [Weissella cibaria]MDY2520507.1 DnaD domain protein [Weissella cibaria]HCU10327.1 hypothetical protein [Weissella cibaria]